MLSFGSFPLLRQTGKHMDQVGYWEGLLSGTSKVDLLVNEEAEMEHRGNAGFWAESNYGCPQLHCC